MKYISSVLTLSLVSLLSACGGGDSNYSVHTSDIGFSDESNSNGGNKPNPPITEDLQKTFNSLKIEAKSLFGHSTNENKGYVDHALDAYAQSLLKISQDIRGVDFTQFKNNRLEKCFIESKIDYRACYVFTGNEINTLLGSKYNKWDFVIDNGIDDENDSLAPSDDLKNIRLKSEDITPALETYYGKTYLFVFENENKDKNLQDISIAGSFSYPFTLNGKEQKRFILINKDTSDFKITATPQGQTTSIEMGALSIYKVPNAGGEYYVTEAGSGFNTLVNDNLNVAFAEPVNFRIDSILGVAPSTYKIKNMVETLHLPSVTINGTRVEHVSASLNDKELSGSIFLEGRNIFNFIDSPIGSTLKFNHTINNIKYVGSSERVSNGINTTFELPQNIKY